MDIEVHISELASQWLAFVSLCAVVGWLGLALLVIATVRRS